MAGLPRYVDAAKEIDSVPADGVVATTELGALGGAPTTTTALDAALHCSPETPLIAIAKHCHVVPTVRPVSVAPRGDWEAGTLTETTPAPDAAHVGEGCTPTSTHFTV
jgi:hypothetical protein